MTRHCVISKTILLIHLSERETDRQTLMTRHCVISKTILLIHLSERERETDRQTDTDDEALRHK